MVSAVEKFHCIFEDYEIFLEPSFSIEDNMAILFFCVSFASPLPPEV